MVRCVSVCMLRKGTIPYSKDLVVSHVCSYIPYSKELVVSMSLDTFLFKGFGQISCFWTLSVIKSV